MNTKQITWDVTSLKGPTCFTVVAPNLEDALSDALVKLGWDISPSLVNPEPEPEACVHCGRVYEDTSQCLSDDCPSLEEPVVSSVLLAFARDFSLDLSLSLNGFLNNRSLSLEREGVYSHRCGNGELSLMSAEDFLRIYPDALGKVWRIVRLAPKEPEVRWSLALTHKSITLAFRRFLARCFYLATYSRVFYIG